MKALLKLSTLTLVASLAACQHTAPTQHPGAVDPVPPVVQGHAPVAALTAAPVAGQTQQQQLQQQQQSAPVITVHLAQENPEESLVAVDVGGASLYALPQPVLTQADMGRVSPVTAQDQQTFILLEMNQHGIPKLQNVTAQAQGHYLLLSVQGQLVSVAQIGEPIADGRLLVGTQNPQHTQEIIRMMQSGQ